VLMHIVDTMEKRDEKNKIPLDMLGRILTTKVQLDDCDYMLLSKKLVKHYTPHELLAFFEKLAGKEEVVFTAEEVRRANRDAV